MDSAKVQKLRRSYPDHVPVICEPEPNDGQKHQHKLIVPHHKTGDELIEIAREKCPWAFGESKVWIKKGHQDVPKGYVKTLDSKQFKAMDDVLYLQVERKPKEAQSQPMERAEKAPSLAASPESDEELSKSVQEFKINCTVPKETRTSKLLSEQPDQSEKARRMKEKYPDRVPVLVNQAECPGLPRLEKKLLVPNSMKVGDLRKSLPKHFKSSEVPWQKVRMLMAGDEVQDDQIMHEIYASYVDPDDGGLHLALELEEEVASFVGFENPLEEPSEAEACEDLKQMLQEVERQRDEAELRCREEEARADRAELREVEALNRLEQAEMRMEDLGKELTKKELALMESWERSQEKQQLQDALTAEIQSLTEELQSKEKTLSAQQAALRRFKNEEESILKLKEMCTHLKEKLALNEESAKVEQEKAKVQLKALEQEKQKLFLNFEALATEKESLQQEVMALKEKEKEEDIVVVGWNQEGHPVDFEDSDSAEGFHVVAP